MPVSHSIQRIGELARSTGLSPDTLRHYERLGLLSPSRTAGRFREYGPDAFTRIQVIQAALAIGFSLAELAEIFAQRSTRRPPCRRVRALAASKLVTLTERIDELTRLRAHLERTLALWDDRLVRTPADAPAGLLDSLAAEIQISRPSTRTASLRGVR